jgi:hypothetical protein
LVEKAPVTKPSQRFLSLRLTPDQALVLFEFLSREAEADKTSLKIVDQAELVVLWNVEAQLEKRLDVVFDPEYGKLLDRAREAVRNMGIEDMPG